LDTVIQDAVNLAAVPPQKRKLSPKPRWTLKRLVTWIKETFNIDCCRETVRKTLRHLGFSWKKAKKLLNKANPKARAEFIEKIKVLLNDAAMENKLLIYIDKAHIHLDSDQGYGWSLKGQRFWVSSSSPGKQKVSFYGAYIYNKGEVRVFPYERAEKFNTAEVLGKLKTEFSSQPIVVLWDRASYHRAEIVRQTAESLNIELEPLPAYSPDFMPVEHLWQWMREDITYHTCYETKSELISQAEDFQQKINAEPYALADRLWVKDRLDPDEEKLRVST
jgi:transposase